MSTKDFTQLDAAIVQAIKDGNRKFYLICSLVGPETVPHRPTGDMMADRLVDRRLQALRKRGRIAYIGGEWYLA